MATDPVCGMFVDERTATLKLTRDNRTYYFCSTSCLEQFAAPEEQLSRLKWRLALAWPASAAVAALTYLTPFPQWVWVALVLASVVQFYPGAWFYRGFLDALRSRVANMDVLIAIGTSVAYFYSVAALVFPTRLPTAYYFDASSLIITLILTGSYLEHLTREHASGALRGLGELIPRTAEVARGESIVQVPILELQVGDLLRVRPGGRFAADGVVERGRSTVNEALVSGESLPVAKAPGNRVLAGSVNGEGVLDVRVTQVGSDTFLAEVGRLLTDAESSQVPIQQLADRIAERFVPLVLALAALAALGWWLFGAGPTIALLVFVSVAITACPCAFGIATPAAIVVGVGRAAEEGVVFRGRDSIEKAATVRVVLTDKTGTLTAGRAEVTDLVPDPRVSQRHLLEVAAGLEISSEHPLARAVVAAATVQGILPAKVGDVSAVAGRGVRGMLDGRPVQILAHPTASIPDSLSPAIRRLESEGRTWSLVEEDGIPLGIIGFSDPMQPGVRETVEGLRREGMNVVLVTGDSEAAARSLAADAGISVVHARVSPAGKLALVRKYQSEGWSVAFVGDGINDAPALAAADLGVAVGTGTDVAREAGRVLLLRPGFHGVAVALFVGRRTVAKVRQNLFWALGYNAVLLPVAMGVLVPVFGLTIFQILPVTGALAMGLSSTTVVLNSLSLRRIRVPGAGLRPSTLRAGSKSTMGPAST